MFARLNETAHFGYMHRRILLRILDVSTGCFAIFSFARERITPKVVLFTEY